MLPIESEILVSKVSSCVKTTAARIWRIFNHWINPALSKDSLETVKRIGMDETSRKKGHHYVTLFADLEQRRLIHVCEGKDAATVESFAESLETKGGSKDKIELVRMDMSPAFIGGVMEHLPKAQLIFDKFHLIQSLNVTPDDARKAERKGNDLLKGHKYTVLKKYTSLTLKKKKEPDGVLLMYPKPGESYRLRELFMDIPHILKKSNQWGT
ncbi:MAG: transposase [Tannerellaceae bacterium]|jgi:transposase|nr:transposase [Tannerellaceae bacterium]